jgi:hypothetical protein
MLTARHRARLLALIPTDFTLHDAFCFGATGCARGCVVRGGAGSMQQQTRQLRERPALRLRGRHCPLAKRVLQALPWQL